MFFTSRATIQLTLLGLLTLLSTSAFATEQKPAKEHVNVQNAWVRPTNPGQPVGAAYMTLTSQQDANLVSVESDVTKSIEIHSMTMKDGVMKMRMLENLPLAAGKPTELGPGSYHLMLFDLKKPLTSGEQVNFILKFKLKDSKAKTAEFTQSIKATVQSPAENNDDAHGHHHHH